jgi:hypothetical protein
VSGFRKAKAEQAALKIGIYGPPGSGKTFTSLLMAEGLAQAAGRRVAYVDTEHGTDFYCKAVPSRAVHPEAFDFDAMYTRSITDVISSVTALKPDEHSVIVLDSITHLWEAAMAAYRGPRTREGGIPINAWGRIKKPYKDLMSFLLSSPMHVIICGRQGLVYEKNEESGESAVVGVKMKAEGETPYEPHILIRMETVRAAKTNEVSTVVAYAEKDRTGVLSGRSFVNPSFDTLCKPLMGLLGGTQARIVTEDEAALVDADALEQAERSKAVESANHLREMSARIDLAVTLADLKGLGKQITPKLKSQMFPADVATLRANHAPRRCWRGNELYPRLAMGGRSIADAYGALRHDGVLAVEITATAGERGATGF